MKARLQGYIVPDFGQTEANIYPDIHPAYVYPIYMGSSTSNAVGEGASELAQNTPRHQILSTKAILLFRGTRGGSSLDLTEIAMTDWYMAILRTLAWKRRKGVSLS